jgi:hypothetical protein
MRVYKLFVLGYGCEVVIGTVSNHLISYFSEHLDIANAVVSNNIDWRDIDDQFHFFGPADSFTVIIIDENEKEIFKADSENIFEKGNNFDFKAVCESPNINLDNNLLMGISLQKGLVFEGTFEADCFESEKLAAKQCVGTCSCRQEFFV